MSPRLHPVVCLAAMLFAWSGAASSRAHACAFDGGAANGLFDGNFVALYPKSSVVYFAIIDAVEQGVLDRSAFEPIVPGPSGYWRAVGRLRDTQARLSAAAEGSPRPGSAVSLVFIESDLWARFEPAAQGFELAAHTPGARAGDVVVVTSEGGLAAIMDGRLPASVAFERGLIAVDGDEAARSAVQALLLAAFDPVQSSQLRTTGTGHAPVRLFGPRR
jgi:hypothetical protein